MTLRAPALPRRLACAVCGAEFSCALSQDCWCAKEPARLPLPNQQGGADCLCPDCMRRISAEQAQ
ncbi:hypothetical protein OO17_27505 [Rhodopseudomonas palustris]|uniref:Cysteine-rich CWC family protein n=1 Tax=Rhodopseudomonas palustris TaxID=1076 RepID=A0A0D7E0J6_RHOPL|nr:hypothetical protein OO17_27505 [Rhodopseudomonas palustris]